MRKPAPLVSPSRAIRVLIVDDSALMRRLLTQMLESDPDIEVVGCAIDAYAARKKIKALNPDVITLDVEMPGMDGLQFLRNLMRLRPMPVVMVSTLTERGAEVTFNALALGAVDYVSKPKLDLTNTLGDYAGEIIAKVKVASQARVSRLHVKNKPVFANQAAPMLPLPNRHGPSQRLIAIGASTGGTEAVREVLEGLPSDGPAVLVVQHISRGFCGQFVQRLNSLVEMQVFEAAHEQPIHRGCVYVAPADHHLTVGRRNGAFHCILTDDEPNQYHRPAVDVLFSSVAESAGSHAVGVILTGMGSDGAVGLAAMRQAGARTIAQDERTSVIWGMPSAAIKLNSVDFVLPLGDVARHIRFYLAATGLSDH